MRLIKDGQLKIVDDSSSLIPVLKNSGWVEEPKEAKVKTKHIKG